MSNEKLIREAAKEFLQERHGKDGCIIVDEFSGAGMHTRPDLMLINEEHIIMVEIKSDKDSLTRLETQIKDYNRFSSGVYVFLDIKHKTEFEKKFKNFYWRCVVVYYDAGSLSGHYGEYISSLSIQKLQLDIFYLLWADERRHLLRPFKGFSKICNCKDYEALFAIYTPKELIEYAHITLYERWKHISQQPKRWVKGYRGATPDYEIKHLDYKQVLFDEFIGRTKQHEGDRGVKSL